MASIKRINRNTAIAWGGAAAVAALLGYGAIREGLFFDEDFYGAEIVLIALGAISGLAGGIVGWRRGRAVIPGWALMPFAIAGVYGIHLLLDPVSVKGTMDSFLRWTAYGAWFVLLSLYLSNARNRKAGWAALQAAGTLLLLGSWFGWFGWIETEGLVFRSDQAELAATGARLAGLLQYPNTFGAIAAFMVAIEWQLLSSRSRWASGFASLLLVPALASLLLTESRGALLALLGAALLSLVLGGRRNLGHRLGTAGVSLAFASLAARWAFDTMRAGDPGNGAWLLAAAAIVGAALLLGLRREADRYGQSFDSSGRVRLVLPGKRFSLASPLWGAILLLIGCAAAYLLLARGEAGGARLDGHYETASARWLYYADALRMFHDRPWIGAGGESWRMLASQYKSVPYIGNEVHSGYLEILIDTGLLGFLLLVGMLFWLVFKMRSRASVAWAPAALLLAHSAIDFDWSYGYAWLLLLLWFALHLRESEEGGMDAAPRPRSAGRKRLAAAPLAAALLLGFAAAALPAAWRSLAAASERESALAAAPSARAAGLRAALESNPAWSRVRLELYPLLRGQERVELLARGLRYDPQSPALEFQLGMAYAELAQPEPAAAHLREALRLDRFDREAQNAAIATMAAMAERYAAAGRDDRAAVAAGAAVDMFERYRELYRFTYEGKTNPWENKVNSLFGSAKFNAASSLLLLGRDEEATALLQEVAEESSEEWGRLAKEKLASLTSE